MKYIIAVKTLDDRTFTFRDVSGYEFEGPIIKFRDVVSGKIKRFSANHCEIQEQENE